VAADNAALLRFRGGLSPLLTVWRRLNVEVDSMTAPPTSGAETLFYPATVVAYFPNVGGTGNSTLLLAFVDDVGLNTFENGRIEIAGFPAYKVLRSGAPFGNAPTLSTLIVNLEGSPGTNVIGKTVKLFDDDDQYLQDHPLYPSKLALPSPLPANTRSADFTLKLRPLFAGAYVDIYDANSAGWNTAQTFSFRRNANLLFPPLPSPDFFGVSLQMSGKDRAGFWAYSVVFAYQAASWEDGDPDVENPTKGNNPKTIATLAPNGMSVLYFESIRDELFGIRPEPIPRANLNNPALASRYRDYYEQWILGIIAHELGHAPGRRAGSSDHGEDGIMISGGGPAQGNRFNPRTVRRFRSVTSWTSNYAD
jgi:hypothetical protein